MKLFIMRHGEASPYAERDSLRELTDFGRKQVDKVAKKSLQDLQCVEQVWVSPYVRAQQTADIVLSHLKETPVRTHPGITPDGHSQFILEEIAALQVQNLLLVSHMPLVGDLVNGLCAKPNGYYSMATAALASIECDVLAMGCCDLKWLR